jgi:hypothetical protein
MQPLSNVVIISILLLAFLLIHDYWYASASDGWAIHSILNVKCNTYIIKHFVILANWQGLNMAHAIYADTLVCELRSAGILISRRENWMYLLFTNIVITIKQTCYFIVYLCFVSGFGLWLYHSEQVGLRWRCPCDAKPLQGRRLVWRWRFRVGEYYYLYT